MKAILISIAVLISVGYGIHWLFKDHKWYRGGGEHKGYVTAVDCTQGGLFRKYCTVYFKTDLATTQEDEYYTDYNAPILKELRQASMDKENVIISYDQIIWRGVSKPDGDYINAVSR